MADALPVSERSGPAKPLPYILVPLTATVVAHVIAEDARPVFADATTALPQAQVAVAIKDVLSITIFEAESGGLFSSTDAAGHQGNSVQLPPQQVDQSGMITVPFAGPIPVVGRTLLQIQDVISSRLSHRALEPQTIVTMADRRSNVVAVLGDVVTPLQYSIEPGGERLLSAIARAGGAKFPGYESTVILKRDGHAERALLSDLLDAPDANIQLRPGDVVYIAHEPRYFISLGATGQASTLGPINRRFSFNDYKITLVDALGEAGGLEDDRADPSAVFVYRVETRAALAAMGLDVSPALPDLIPTIYQADLHDPTGYFMASKFPMHNEDILFVANARSTDLNKFLLTIQPLTSTVYTGVLIGK